MELEGPRLPWGPPSSGLGVHLAQPTTPRGSADPSSQWATAPCPWLLEAPRQPPPPCGHSPPTLQSGENAVPAATTSTSGPLHQRTPPGAATPERGPRKASLAFSLMVQHPGLPREEGQPPTHTAARLSSREALLQAPQPCPLRGPSRQLSTCCPHRFLQRSQGS